MPSQFSKSTHSAKVDVRPLTAGDLERVVEIDSAIVGRIRSGFFERRLRAATKNPKNFVYVGALQDGVLQGFAFVRLLAGEFGTNRSVAVLDAIGVDPQAQGHGIGRALMADIDRVLKAKKISDMHTQSTSPHSGLLGFLEQVGFVPAPRLILARDVNSAHN